MAVAARPSKLWWLIGLILFSICLVVQLPARWLVAKFAPNNPYLQQISGNLWHGQANWQVMTSSANPLSSLAGSAEWQWQPWQLLTGKLGMVVTIATGKTQLMGNAKFGKNSWQLQDVSGKIAPETLKQLVSWQLPDTPIMVKSLTLAAIDDDKTHITQFQQASGSLTWAGGDLGYPMGGKVYKITMPSMNGTLSQDGTKPQDGTKTTSGQNANTVGQRLHLALTNQQAQRLGDLYLDGGLLNPASMLDVALTQRLLKQMPDFKGQGADDSVVVSLRQSLASVVK